MSIARLTWINVTKDLRLEGGVFLWKDFGNPVLKAVRPTFRATWTTGKQQIILGNIRAAIARGVQAPGAVGYALLTRKHRV